MYSKLKKSYLCKFVQFMPAFTDNSHIFNLINIIYPRQGFWKLTLGIQEKVLVAFVTMIIYIFTSNKCLIIL